MRIKDIEFLMILAPREVPLVDESLASLRAAGVNEKVYIFAEPDSPKPQDLNIVWVQNLYKYGCFNNWAKAIETMCRTTKPYMAMIHDDHKYRKDLVDSLLNCPDEFGYCSLTTAEGYGTLLPEDFGWHELNRGWHAANVIPIMPTKTARAMIKSSEYKEHRDNYEANEQIDAFCGLWMQAYGLKTYYHNPSLAESIDLSNSTLGHDHPAGALNFNI